MGTSNVWLSIARILATFDITKAVGEDGQVIEPTYEYFAGMVVCVPCFLNCQTDSLYRNSQPLPFKCSIKPRSEKAAALIKASLHK
jgi:hypothetical protein